MQQEIQIPKQEFVDTSSLKVDGKNPNRMTKEQHDRLATSIKKYGFIVPIITNKDLLIADGEQRWTVAKSLGMAEVSVIRLPVEEVDRRLLRQVLNKLRGEHELLLDAEEFEAIIALDGEEDLKFLLNLSDEKINKYINELHKDPLQAKGMDVDLSHARILNLYAGIGGNRLFWGEDLDITAVEFNKEIADCYQKFYPNDKVIITDAHEYLEDNFDKFDFIWTSPPCPTHSKLRKNFSGAKPIYPDMKLYEEILFLQGYFEGKFVVENVMSWYDPLIEPKIIGRHYFWTNFDISQVEIPTEIGSIDNWQSMDLDRHGKLLGFEHPEWIPNQSDYPKDKILRNCVSPLLGEHIIKAAFSTVPKLIVSGENNV